MIESKRKYDQKTRRIGRLTARLAKYYKVSESTIKRDGQYAAAIEQLAQFFDITPNQIVGTASKKDIINAASLIAKCQNEPRN